MSCEVIKATSIKIVTCFRRFALGILVPSEWGCSNSNLKNIAEPVKSLHFLLRAGADYSKYSAPRRHSSEILGKL